jgi:N-acetylmuramoyl-L-alanine amidase
MTILDVPSPHFNERLLPVDAIIIHYTDMQSAEEALAWLSNPASNVSCHYLIDEEGKIYRLVKEAKRAWHAGESYWQGCTDLNSCSIGIELANPGHSYGYIPFPEAQIHALIKLCHDIRTRWDIPPVRILGHSDIAPRRKQDPGHLFPWDTLAREGLGLRPMDITIDTNIDVTEALEKIGYETVSPRQALLAFQRHFQPHKVNG